MQSHPWARLLETARFDAHQKYDFDLPNGSVCPHKHTHMLYTHTYTNTFIFIGLIHKGVSQAAKVVSGLKPRNESEICNVSH